MEHMNRASGADLKRDVSAAESDGRNTPGQIMILIYFYTAFICGANIVVTGIALLGSKGGTDALIAEFGEVGASNVGSASTLTLIVIVIIALYAVVNAVGMWAAAKITTVYTVLQSLIQVLCVLYSTAALGLIFSATYVICLNQFSGDQDLNINTPMWFAIAWGSVMFCVCIFGVLAAKSESKKSLLGFSASLAVMTVALLVGFYFLAGNIEETIDSKCGGVVTVMSDKGWGQLFACDKYAGKAKRWDSDLNAHVTATSPGIAAAREDYKFERTVSLGFVLPLGARSSSSLRGGSGGGGRWL
jgi:hypothetical protein